MSDQQAIQPHLVMRRGPRPNQRFPLQKGVLTIGRADDNDIVVDDSQVSRHHARLVRWGEGWALEDLGSPNGTFVNGQRVTGQVALAPGSQVGLGPNVLFSLESLPPPAATPTKKPRRSWWAVPAILLIGLLVIIGLAWGLFTLAGRAAETRERPPKVAVKSLRAGDRVSAERDVLVQAVSMDPAGVTRVELWVDGELIDSETPSDSASASPEMTSLSWQPDSPGEHTLMVKVENGNGVVSQDAVVVEAVEGLIAVDSEGEEIYAEDVTQLHYMVGQGDTLAEIAQLYDVGETEIVALNPDVDPVALAPGAMLAVPFDPASWSRPEGAPPEEEDDETEGGRGGGPPEEPPVFAPNPPDGAPPPGAPPDLMITNLTLSTLNPSPGEEITVGVTILNAGGTAAENFDWSWGPGTGEGRIHSGIPIDILTPGDDVIREMTYTYQQEGAFTARARADSQDTVDEGENEDNNVAYADVTVGSAPAGSIDLAITNLTLSNYAPAPGEEITVGVTILNAGSATAENVYWSWSSGTGEGRIHAQAPIEILAPGDDVVREMTYVYQTEGQFTGRARADSRDGYDEGDNEGNNVARADITVGGAVSAGPVDVAITNLTLSALNPRPGEEVIFGVTIANQGGMLAEDFQLSLLSGDQSAFVHVDRIDYLAPGDDVVSEFTYVYEEEGGFSACVIADSFGAYPRDENNEACQEVVVSEAGASVGAAAEASGGVLGEAVGDLGGWAQDLAGVSPPAAPHIVSSELSVDYAEDVFVEFADACHTTLQWRDRSEDESGFKVYRWDASRDDFDLVVTLRPNDGFDIVQYVDTWTINHTWSSGPNWYYVAAFNGGGEAASDYVVVDVPGVCSGGSSPAEIEFVGMIVDKQYDDFYCYLSLDESPWFRVPENQDAFMPVEYGPIEDDLFGMGQSGESYYHVNLFDYLGGENSLILYADRHEDFSLAMECFGWQGGSLHNLGTYRQDHPPEAWADTTGIAWMEEAHGPDGWFAFWYATRGTVIYRGEAEPTLVDHTLAAATNLRLTPSDCAWWHDSCSLRWEWDGDNRMIDGFHLEDDFRTLDDAVPPGARHFDVNPFEVMPYPYCQYPNRVKLTPFRDVHEGQAAYLDVEEEDCGITVKVRLEEVLFGETHCLPDCAFYPYTSAEEITGWFRVSGLEKEVVFGPIGIGLAEPPREGTLLTVGSRQPANLEEALSLWNPWVAGGEVFPTVRDGDALTIEWYFHETDYGEGSQPTHGHTVCTGSVTHGPLSEWDWQGFYRPSTQHSSEDGDDALPRDGCLITWSINR